MSNENKGNQHVLASINGLQNLLSLELFQLEIEQFTSNRNLLRGVLGETPSAAEINYFVGHGALFDALGDSFEKEVRSEGWTDEMISKVKQAYRIIFENQWKYYKDSDLTPEDIRKKIGVGYCLNMYDAEKLTIRERTNLWMNLLSLFKNPSSWKSLDKS